MRGPSLPAVALNMLLASGPLTMPRAFHDAGSSLQRPVAQSSSHTALLRYDSLHFELRRLPDFSRLDYFCISRFVYASVVLLFFGALAYVTATCA